MKRQFYLSFFFAFVFLAISAYHLYCYREYKAIINSGQGIEYRYSGKETRSGRGVHYLMMVYYREKPFAVNITGDNYHDIDQGIFPKLYYSPRLKEVFSEWDKTKDLRIVVLFSIGCLIALIAIYISWKERKQS